MTHSDDVIMAGHNITQACVWSWCASTTYLTAEQDRRLKELAERHHTTEAEILRRALDSWLPAETSREGGDPLEGLIGIVAGPSEVDHDDIYG